MPTRPPRECRHPGCHELTTSSYCDAHRGEHDRQVDARRPSPSKRGYGGTWKYRRRAALSRDNYQCVICGAIASDVDHIIPLARGGTNHLENLQSLCHACHSRKTVTQDGGLGK